MKTNYQAIRILLLIFVLTGFTFTIKAQNAWINEVHYDNVGTDANEFIEVVIENAGSYNLVDFSVILYTGSNGSIYNTKTLDLFTAGAVSGNFSLFYYVYPVNGIQNGGTSASEPDGMTLNYQGALIASQWLSYEGTFTGAAGPANGLISVNIGVMEDLPVPPAGQSLQLSGSGSQYSDFIWQAPATATAGALNNGQTIAAPGVSNPANFDAVASSTTQNDLSWALNGNSDTVMVAQNSMNTFGTPTGVYAVGGAISGGGTVLYKGTGTTTSHTGLTPNTKYYYKAWSKTAANEYSIGVVDSSTTLKIEPSNYPTDLIATATGITVTLDWTDATGTQLPDAYLIKISNLNNITAPADGIPVADDRDVSDGTGAVSVAYGLESFTFYSLEETTNYYFKIYSYTNSGAGINYKTDGTAPANHDTTQSIINTNNFESNTFETWTAYSVVSNKNWAVLTGTGAYSTAHYANMNGFGGDVLSNDWLISPSLNLGAFTNEKIIFFTSWQFSTEVNELKFKYSTDYTSGDPSLATWTELTFIKSTVTSIWVPSGFIDISAISGTNVHFAFQYLSASLASNLTRSWNVDEIEITGNGVSNPTNFNAATVSSTEIGMTWNKNNNNNNVMVAWNTTNTFGTPSGTYPPGGFIFGGGTVLYTGQNEFYNHTGRNPATQYYYKAWSVDGSNIYSGGVTDNAYTQFPEPSNHPTGLMATANGPSQITVSWTDSDAAHYLVKGSSIGYSSIVPPVDGVGQGDSLLVKNVNLTVQSSQFTGLTPNTAYYFKIFPYNGVGEASNYKTGGTVPQASATTDVLDIKLIISEVSDPRDSANAKFVEVYNIGNSSINLTTYPVYLCRQANAGSWADVQLTGTINSGETQVIAYINSSFTTNYGFSPTQASNKISGNGNDGYFLYYGGNQATGQLIDSYGVINEDGLGKTWEYTDKKAVRKRTISAPNTTWTASEWVILPVFAMIKDMTPGYHKGTLTWQGTTSTNWNTKGNNWSSPYGYIPDGSCNVTIPNVTNYPIVTEPSACHLLLIQSGSTLSVQSTGSLLIVGP